MAMTLKQQQDAYQFFIIAFGAAPGTVYMDQLNDAYAAGMTTKQIVNVYTTKPQFTALYPNFLTSAEFANSLVNNVVKNSASSAAKAQAVADIEGALASGMTRGDVIHQVFSNLAKLPVTDAMFGNTVKLFNNQIAVAEYYTENQLGNATDIATLRAVVSGVTATSDVSSPAAISALIAGPAPAMAAFTVGQDNIAGNASNNLFEAAVVQNALGAQVNTLGSGDKLDGGAGMDTLSAKVTAGAFINGGNVNQGTSTMPIQPETHSVETVKLQAVNSAIAGSNLFNGNGAASTEVFINAKNLYDVTKISSDNSDANLTIQNLTTLNTDLTRHALKDMTIGMAYTGNSDSAWKESDLDVYFDQDYITPQVSSASSVDIRVMNQDAYDVNGISTALGIPVSTAAIGSTFISDLKITLNGKQYDLGTYLTREQSPGNSLQNYPEALAAVQAAIVKLKAANPTDAALQTLTASIIAGNTFTADAPVDSTTGLVSGIARVGQAITLSVSGGATANTLKVDTLLLSPVNQSNTNMNLFNRSLAFNPTSDSNLAINVDLTKVGNWGDGGSLVIGSMFKDGLNNWSSLYKGKGINEFDVTVYGTQVTNGDDQSSSLKQLASTGNNLKIVKVVSDALVTKDFADLTIGNSQTETAAGVITALAKGAAPSANNANALKDVQTFDASGFKGDLSLFAALSNEVTAKYLNVVDGSPAAPAADNVKFAYTGGTGNDYINLSLDPSNLAKPGTATREDMTLTVNGGAGNDEIVVKIAEVFDQQFVTSNWYANQHILANLALVGGAATGQLQLNGGENNDTIRTLGAGDFALNGGAGNDTIYADNTGSGGATNYALTLAQPLFNSGRGSVAFNAANSNPYDLLSQDRTMTFAGVSPAKVNVTVNFLGFEKSIEVMSTSVGGVQNITDLMINQAIKTAVNADPVLMKLAIAEDGPGNTLVLRSLIDGNLNINPATGLPHAGTAADQVGNYSITLTPVAATSVFSAVTVAQLDTAFGTTNGLYSNSNWMTQGKDSTSPSDNLIVGGTGDDVIVLGTAGYHASGNQFLGSNDTVAWAGFNNGIDSIVNFDTGNHMSSTTMTVTTGRAESFTVTFGNITAGVTEKLQFDGVVINLNDGLAGLVPAKDVALAFAEQYAAAVGENWAVSYTPGSNSVTLTNKNPLLTPDTTNVEGNVATNPTNANFDFTTAANDGTAVVSNYVEGLEANSFNQAATPATFTLDFDANNTGTDVVASANGTIGYFGATIAYINGDGAISLAAKFAAASYTNFTAALKAGDPTQVVFTAKVAGTTATPDGVGPIAEQVNGVDPTVNSSTPGAAAVTGGGTFTTTSVPVLLDQGIDYLDFSSYGAKAVYVNNVLVNGLAPAVGQTFISLVEGSGVNAGKYTISQFTEAGAADTVVGVIGTADFGVQQNFTALNFII